MLLGPSTGPEHGPCAPTPDVRPDRDESTMRHENTLRHETTLRDESPRCEKLLNPCTVAPLFATQASGHGGRTTVGPGSRGTAVGQTILELAAGAEFSQLQDPDQATILVQVLSGRVELAADEASWLGGPGDLLIVPQPEHTLRALEPSAVMLTAVPRVRSAPRIRSAAAQIAVVPTQKATRVPRWRSQLHLGFH